jgi:PAS domain S-box-containing protein
MLAYSDFIQIFDHLPAPALVLLTDSPNFTIAGSNKAYRTICNGSACGVPGNHFSETAASFLDETGPLHKVMAHKAAIVVEAREFVFVKGQARHFDVTYTPLFGAEGQVKFILRTLHEVTASVNSRSNEEKISLNLQENIQLLAHVQEMAHFGNWRWDIPQNKVTWSETLYHIYGLDKDAFKATFEGYQELLHPEDRAIAYNSINTALQTGEDVVFEERIIRPDGKVRYLRSWGRVQHNADDQPVRMIGACLDITETKLSQDKLQKHIEAIEKQNKQLQEIAWIQSHVVRAPLVRIMGLVELMKQYTPEEISLPETFDQILAAALELDNIIKDITSRTEQLANTGIAD